MDEEIKLKEQNLTDNEDWAVTAQNKQKSTENIISHRIPANHYFKISNSKLLCYLDNEKLVDDDQIITQNPLTDAHLVLTDMVDTYAEVNHNGDVTVFTLPMITREFYHIKGKHAPTPEQLTFVEELLETLAHTHIIQPNENGEPTRRAILYLKTTLRTINGQKADAYELSGFSALRDYARIHNIKYTSIKSEYIRLPQGIKATARNVILYYVIIRALKEHTAELYYNDLYTVCSAQSRKDRLTIRTKAREMLLKCLQSEAMRKELLLTDFSMLKDENDNTGIEPQPIGFELKY